MTSTITQFSSLIDTTFPVPGADNDTQGFRDNYIRIQRGFDVATSEITDLQQTSKELTTRLNDATVVGNNYANIIASTVTTLVIASLTNKSPDIVTPTVSLWYNNTITNDIANLQGQINTNTNNLQLQITNNTQNIIALQSTTNNLITTATTLWGTVYSLTGTVADNTLDISNLQTDVTRIDSTATYAWETVNSLLGGSVAQDIADLYTTTTNLWNIVYGPTGLRASVNTANNNIAVLDSRSQNTGSWIAQIQSSVNNILGTYSTVSTTATNAWLGVYGPTGINASIVTLQSDVTVLKQAAINTNTNIVTLQSQYGSLSTTVSGHTTQITAINNFTATGVTYSSASPPLNSKGSPGDRPGMIYANQNYMYVCIGTYTGSADIWMRVNVSTSTWS